MLKVYHSRPQAMPRRLHGSHSRERRRKGDWRGPRKSRLVPYSGGIRSPLLSHQRTQKGVPSLEGSVQPEPPNQLHQLASAPPSAPPLG
eukprot:scaffold90805_cov28-Tisochrysis_lutea.AAC.1